MKIAIASQDGIRVTEHAGRCRRFYVFTHGPDDVLERECRVIEPSQTFHALSDSGDNPLRDCHVLIAGSIGTRLRSRLERDGISPVICHDCDPEHALMEFLAGRLPGYADPEAES